MAKHRVKREKVRMGVGKHAYWCMAVSTVDRSPCLVINRSALELGLTVDFDAGNGDVCVNGPRELMVGLMQDAYESHNGKPYEMRLARSLIRGISHGEDYVAFVLNDDKEGK